MSISSEEVATIRAEHKFLKEQVGQVVEALKENTETTREMLRKMDEHDVREEYRLQEIEGMKDAISNIDTKIDSYVEENKEVISWAKWRKGLYDSLWSGATSNTGKFISIAIVVGLAMFLGLDLPSIKVG